MVCNAYCRLWDRDEDIDKYISSNVYLNYTNTLEKKKITEQTFEALTSIGMDPPDFP